MYQISNLHIEGLNYGFSEVSEGNLSFLYGDEDEVIKNRKNFIKNFKISGDQTVAMFVRQGDVIEKVGKSSAGNLFGLDRLIECDAMMTTEKNIALFLLIADCIPLIIKDKKNQLLSVIHVGIANTKIAFPRKVIETIQNNYNIASSDLDVIIGPSLQKEHFIYEFFEEKDSDMWKGFVEETVGGKFMIDNVGVVVKQLKDCGIKEENIHDCKIDTYTDERFFSHKRDYDNRDKDKGRFAAIAMLV